jgi:plasmid stabilization system protein ParE
MVAASKCGGFVPVGPRGHRFSTAGEAEIRNRVAFAATSRSGTTFEQCLPTIVATFLIRTRTMESMMPRGDKSKYTDKQKRQAEHIAEGYEASGDTKKKAKARAWATVNKLTKGGKKPGGSGRGQLMNLEPAKKGGRRGGAAAAARPTAARSASARKAARTRARRKARRAGVPGKASKA